MSLTTTEFTRLELREKFSAAANLQDLIKAIEGLFMERGEVVCQFAINGMVLSEDDESRLGAVAVDEIDVLRIQTQKPQDLLKQLLENWIRELPELMRNADQLTQEIKFKGIEGHLKAFVDLLDTCQFLTESLISLESILELNSSQKEHWHKAEVLTARAIEQALKNFENKDFVLLAEILEYDLGHALQTWFDQIKQLHQQICAVDASARTASEDQIANPDDRGIGQTKK